MNNILELHEFFVEGKNHKKSHVLLHIAEPVSEYEKKRGYFFVVAEIKNGYEEQIEYLQKIIDDIESRYYDEEEQSENLLEQILQEINRRAHHILQYENTEIHCIVGVMQDKKLSLTYHGDPKVALFFKNKDKLSYTRIIDQETEQTEQLFSEMIEGNINPGDYVLICTPHILDYFSYDRIRKIFTNKSTRISAEHIQKVLQDMSEDTSFGGIVLHITDKHDTPRTGQAPKDHQQGSKESLNKLLESAKTTEETLSPPILGYLKGRVKDIGKQKKGKGSEKKSVSKSSKHKEDTKENKPKREHRQYRVETNYRKKAEKPENTFWGKLLISLGQAIFTIGKGIGLIILKAVSKVLEMLRTLFFIITNKKDVRSHTVRSLKKTVGDKKEFVQRMPIISKLILSITIVLGIFFVSSLTYLKVKENRDAQAEQYNNTVQAVIDKKDAAEAALVYDEKKKAFELLKEAEELVKTLPDKKKKEKEKITELNSQLDVFLQKLRNMKVVQPELFFAIESLNENAQAETMELIDGKLIVFGSEDGMLYEINTSNAENSVQTLDTIKNFIASAADHEKNYAVLLTKDNRIAGYNIESGAITAKDISYQNENISIKSLNIYNRKIYSLDTQNNQIYKHNPTQTGYDQGSPWIQDTSTDLSDGVSIIVDGNIFVLKQNGEIVKFFRGNPQSFEISGLDPKLENPKLIWTNSDSNNLYILESTNQRIIVLNKDGKFRQQFTAQEWQDPKSMAIDEEDGSVYVLDSNRIYKFAL